MKPTKEVQVTKKGVDITKKTIKVISLKSKDNVTKNEIRKDKQKEK